MANGFMIPSQAGVGLRYPHYEYFLENKPPVPWIEVSPENHRIGVRHKILEKVRQDYPLSVHGVGLSLGSDEPLSMEHLKFLKSFCETFEPGLVSEHIAWARYDQVFMNDLLPLPYTQETLEILVDHIQETQEFLGRPILVENPSSYLQFDHSSMTEEVFMVEVAKKSGCGILLDVNNIYVSSKNHGFDPKAYIQAIPGDLIGEIHLAGHQVVKGPHDKTLLIDHHGDHVAQDVWDLYGATIAEKGRKPTLIEWDNNIPEVAVLLEEAEHAEAVMDSFHAS